VGSGITRGRETFFASAASTCAIDLIWQDSEPELAGINAVWQDGKIKWSGINAVWQGGEMKWSESTPSGRAAK